MIGVVPVLPTLTALALLLPALLLSLLTGLAALRRPEVAKQVLRLVWRQKFALLVLALGVVVVRWTTVCWPRAANDEARAAMPAEADWPMDRGGLQRRGWVPGESSPAAGGLHWSSGGAGEAFWASPTVVGDRVYCVSSRGDRGLICCWDADTGRRLWSAAPAGYRATFSSPVISGRYLLCGEGLHHARLARVVCLDLESPRAGRVLWTFATNGHVECTPVVAEDRVYVGAGDDGVYCLSLDPSVSDRERVVWHAPGDRYPDAETSLAVCGDRVFVGLGQGGEAICLLDAATGRELARRPMPYPVFSPPAVEGGQLFVGLGRGDYVRPVADPAGCVRCFDSATLRERWSFPLGATVLGAVAVTEEHVFVGCCDGHVYLLDRAGRLLQKWNGGSPILAAPAVTDRLVYVVNQDGMLVALDARWLQPVWERRLGAPGRYFSAPSVARGHVYAGTPEDGLQCLGEAPPHVGDEIWPGEGGGAGAAGCRDGSRVPLEARIRWQFDRLGNDASPLEATASVAAAAGTIVVPFQAGAETGLAAIPWDDRSDVRPRWVRSTPAIVKHSPVVAGGRVLAVSGQTGGATPRLDALDLATGHEQWSRTLQARDAALTAASDCVFVQDVPGRLSCLDLDGEVRWTSEVGLLRHGPDASTPLLVLAVQTPPGLVAFDALSGQTLWTRPLARPAATPPAVRGRRVYFADEAGIQVRSLIDGSELGQFRGDVSGPLYVAPDRYAYIDLGGNLVLGESAGGTVLAQLPGAVAGTNPLVGFNRILFCTPGGMTAADLQGRDPGPFVECSPFRITAAPVLHAGRVYLGIAGRGLVCLAGDDAS
ncbi:MAG: PQQ-binding-like beta-propeller repeat protein [Candidatus Anammoximicrobium sp.]|nr:PQQ-binding-like beta-propeller repeat protein [Candidatus Anammoximicrobium sp.]